MNCPDNCPQLVKGANAEGVYFLCSAKTTVVGFKTPIRGAVKLKIEKGKPVKREDCR